MDSEHVSSPPPPLPELHEEVGTSLPWLFIGLGLFILLIVGIIVVVMFEQNDRTEQKLIDQQLSLIKPPTPTPWKETYSPLPRRTISRAEALAYFKQVAFDRDPYGTGGKLIRWDSQPVTFWLRGQFADQDRLCLDNITGQLNAAAQSGYFRLATETPGGAALHLFILPHSDFSSINPDIRPDDPGQIFLSTSGGSFSGGYILIDLDKPIEERCALQQQLVSQAVGIASHIPDTVPQATSQPAFVGAADFGSTDLEMVHILYSPLLTSGLTWPEVERRLE